MSDIVDNQLYVLISVNPKAGRKSPKRRAEILKSALEKEGFIVELHTDLELVTKRANELFVHHQLRALVGVGGDGTAAELTNRTLAGVPITLLPSGTANLIAKYLRLPFEPTKAAKMIASGKLISFDAGKANGRLFLVMISAGIDADIVQRVHTAREESYKLAKKKGAHISYWSYLKPIFRSICSYKYSQITTKVISEQKSNLQIIGKWSFVFNLPRYGWGLPLVPNCVGVDRRLDFCIFQGGKLLSALLGVFFAQMGSLHRFLPNVKLGQGTVFRLEAFESSVTSTIPYQLDGDPGGFLPLDIEILPNRFTTLAPQYIVDKLERSRISG